jgi:uncharacterized protein YbjT (DUF2867 family)
MAEKKVIAVAGATGAQGGGLVRAIAADPEGGFAARALTRDTTSDKAAELTQLGAEVVQADVDDEESLVRAFDGAHGAFCVTFFWDHYSPETEMSEAGNMARAAKRAGVKHVIWSTLEDTRRFLPISDDRMPVLQEKYNVPHFDGKGEANYLFTDAGVPTTFLQTAFYWENMIYFGLGPHRDEDGQLALALPMGDRKLPGMASEDIGKTAYEIFRRGEALVGRTVSIAGEHLTGAEMAASLSEALGEEVVYNAVPPDVFRGFGFPGADDVGNMFQFKHDFQDEYVGVRDLDEARKLNPSLQTFDAWLAENKDRIPIE